MLDKILVISCIITYTLSSPLPKTKESENSPNRVLYDQRQEGDWNVRADLENFVIVIVPTSTNSSPGLLDFFRSAPSRSHLKKIKHIHHTKEEQGKEENDATEKPDPANAPETVHFIESKSAPYHVDLSKSRSHLQKLHPEAGENGEIVIANSPNLNLMKAARKALELARNSRVYIPMSESEFISFEKLDSSKKSKKELKKKTIKENQKDEKKKEELHLIGSNGEECGPGRQRDSYGVCQNIEK